MYTRRAIYMLYYYHKDAIHVSKIDLLVQDLQLSKTFYTKSLGFSVLKETKNIISLTVDHQNEIICLHKSQHKIQKDNQHVTYDFAILLPSRLDLSKFLHHCIVHQIPIDGAADHMVSEAIYLRDPNGIGIEVSCDRDDSKWLKLDQHYKMDALPFDYKGVFYEAGESDIFTSLPSNTTIGHIHLLSKNLDKVKTFYKDIIGFNIVKELNYEAVYLSDKNYHHHLSINAVKHTLTQYHNIRSFTLSYPNCEKFKKTYDNIIENNIHYEETSEGIRLVDPEHTRVYLKLK